MTRLKTATPALSGPAFLLGLGLSGLGLGLGLVLHAAPARADGSQPDYSLAPKIVDQLNVVFGARPGLRKAHPKGECIAGTFTADPESAASITKAAPYNASKPYPVIGRVSMATGNPKIPDTAHAARGLAVRLAPSADEDIDLVMITTPMFGASTAEEFLGLLTAITPDPATGKPDKARLDAFFSAHPSVTRQMEWGNSHPVGASYVSTNYYGVHAFKFVDKAGKVSLGKIVVKPVGAAETLSDADAKEMGPDYLFPELEKRLAKAPAAMDVFVQLGLPGDPSNDPSRPWPEDRKLVHLGRLTIEKTTGQSCASEMFDPSRISAGVEMSDDPVLPIRSAAYGVSLGQRIGGK